MSSLRSSRYVILALALVLVAGAAAILRDRPSTAEKLADALGDPAAGISKCKKAGAIAFAGARSTLYRCSVAYLDAIGEARHRVRYGVWEDGSAYDVTAQARALDGTEAGE